MALFKRKEKRDLEIEDSLLAALLQSGEMTAEKALNIPALAGSVEFIASTIAMLPIKLYEESDGKANEITDDYRLKLLNDETGDLLNAYQAKKAFIIDTLLEGAGYMYINKSRNKIASLNYVKKICVSVNEGTDPIFKRATILINGKMYEPTDFLILTRNSVNGVKGIGVVKENSRILTAAYNALVFEQNLTKKGGSKKGFLTYDKKMSKEAKDELKETWRELYANDGENMMILQDGMNFKETSCTSVELQLNENKVTNADQICALFNLNFAVISGKAGSEEYASAIKTAVLPTIYALQTALNKSLLLEVEKGNKYFALDTTELMKGDILKRYQAYRLGLDSNFLQIDEVRYKEDLKPLNFNYIKLGLDSVLLDPTSNIIYTANTNQTAKLGEAKANIGTTK